MTLTEAEENRPRFHMLFRLVMTMMLATALAGCSATGPATPSPSITPLERAASTDPLAVLHSWDADRARAWERGNDRELERLYLPGSRAGQADVRLMQRYRARGITLRGLRMQVLSVRVVVKNARRLTVVVVERFAGAEATSTAGTRQLPVGVPVRRSIVLRRPADRWLVVSVRTLPREEPR